MCKENISLQIAIVNPNITYYIFIKFINCKGSSNIFKNQCLNIKNSFLQFNQFQVNNDTLTIILNKKIKYTDNGNENYNYNLNNKILDEYIFKKMEYDLFKLKYMDNEINLRNIDNFSLGTP